MGSEESIFWDVENSRLAASGPRIDSILFDSLSCVTNSTLRFFHSFTLFFSEPNNCWREISVNIANKHETFTLEMSSPIRQWTIDST